MEKLTEKEKDVVLSILGDEYRTRNFRKKSIVEAINDSIYWESKYGYSAEQKIKHQKMLDKQNILVKEIENIINKI